MWVTPFTYLIMSKHAEQPWNWGVSIHWTGLLDWTTGLDYWTDLFASKNLFFLVSYN